jgi:hypothetical protein
MRSVMSMGAHITSLRAVRMHRTMARGDGHAMIRSWSVVELAGDSQQRRTPMSSSKQRWQVGQSALTADDAEEVAPETIPRG